MTALDRDILFGYHFQGGMGLTVLTELVSFLELTGVKQ